MDKHHQHGKKKAEMVNGWIVWYSLGRRFHTNNYIFLYQFEHNAENPVFIVAPAIDFEGANLACILYVSSNAGTHIIVTNAHQA